jgi:ComF family protein
MRLVRRLWDSGLDLLYPAVCSGCGSELIAYHELPFCPKCIGQLSFQNTLTCLRCGAAISGVVARDECRNCRGSKWWFDECVVLGEYDGLLRDWLLWMKDSRGESLALALADLIWQRNSARLVSMRPDIIVPVPMHWRRRLVRGTNSPALLAERLAQRLRVRTAAKLLRRTRNTPPQFSLPPSERSVNVRNAFAVRQGHHLKNARVLVVDDILTTGSTASAVAKALKKAGAAYVGVAVAARTIRH